ncbi:translation initiation factor eIF-2B subunit alpha [Lobaria immixta]|nr:translation initiation factor eIF-2B subunit alpha [Lobaria immixta]
MAEAISPPPPSLPSIFESADPPPSRNTPTSPRNADDSHSFDIVQTYHNLLRNDPLLTMPVAAIEALVLLLYHSPPSTISETLSLLATHTARLKRSVRNPIPLSAGTDLFQRYLISTLQSSSSSQRSGKHGRSGTGTGAGRDDFRTIRAHLMSNGRLFVKRAKEARGKIAAVARHFVRDGTTVLTSGGSRVVSAVLTAAAENAVRFRVVYVRSSSPESAATPPSLVTTLRGLGVPVAIIPEGAVAFSMSQITTVMVGAEGVVENGGIISRMGTYQLGLLAHSGGKPFYVVVESHKFVRLYPVGQGDLGIGSGGGGGGGGGALDFRTDGGKGAENGEGGDDTGRSRGEEGGEEEEEAVDFTPPELITALITESGVHTPSAVSEELIKIWY